MMFLVLASLLPPEKYGDKEALWLIAGIFGFVALCVSLLIRRARLELSENGVRLRQSGYTLESAWPNLSEIILTRGAESFITRDPMTGKASERFATAAALGRLLVGFYDSRQLELIARHRLIPIEAFGWHLRNGRRLRSALIHFAPQLQTQPGAPISEQTGSSAGEHPGKIVK